VADDVRVAVFLMRGTLGRVELEQARERVPARRRRSSGSPALITKRFGRTRAVAQRDRVDHPVAVEPVIAAGGSKAGFGRCGSKVPFSSRGICR
jgi:hypothetical protein